VITVGRPGERVRAIVLAAGEGRRFGGPKQLAQVHGRPLIAHALALAAPYEPLVVLGARAEQIRPVVGGAAEVVVAEDWAEGQAASLRAGVAAFAGAVDWALVLLADQPFLTPAVVEGVLAARGDDVDAVRAVFGGRPGHPVLLGRRVLAEVPSLKGDTGARDLLARFRVRVFEASRLCDPTDIDTPNQLEVLPS
jgi:CTP:molybdopterin cytidylyltransferase MocA